MQPSASLDSSRQKEEHEKWVKEEKGIEHPTHIETLLQPEQQARIRWLKENCFPATEILDIGCNWGYILNAVNGKEGIDINPENILEARESFPLREFNCGDVTIGLRFEDNEFAIVILADILEHLEWFDDVAKALKEALRIARRKVLITLPWRQDDKCAGCFKIGGAG